MKLYLFILMAVAIGAFAVLSIRQDRKRKRLLRAWGRSRGFKVHDGKETGWDIRCPGFQLFDRGHDRYSTMHLEGDLDGRPVRCVDYRFTTGSGDDAEKHRYGAVVLDMGTPVIPLQIRREHAFDRVGEFMGFNDIDFESAEFSRRFHVSSSDRKWAYDVIHGETMEYLMTLPAEVTVAFGMAEVAVFLPGSLTGHRCQQGLKIVRALRDLVPAGVLAQLRGE